MARFPVVTALVLAFAPAATLSAQTIFVTTVNDVADFGGLKQVANLPGPDGKVSMREAAIAATNTPGPQTIGFQVPAGQWGAGTFGPRIINATTSFPINGDDTTVDGTTQTAFTGDLNPNGAEVSFHSTAVDPPLVVSGIFSIGADRCHFLGLGDMTNRSFGLDFQTTAEECTVTACTIKGKFAAVRVQGDRNVVGGVLPGQGNVLWSLSDGVRIQGFGKGEVAEDNVVIGNTLSGEFNGVQIVGEATGNRIGGFAPGEANHISGAGYLQEDNTPDGAMIRIESNGNFVYGNLLGTDVTGTVAADNVGDVGVEIYGDQNEVRGNVIGGITGLVVPLSVQAGISLREGAELNVIQGNWIGVDASGTIPLPNFIGIRVSAFDSSLPMPVGNLIGGLGAGEANVIAHNESAGVVVLLDTEGNRISGNEIRDNHAAGGLGIDLGGDGVTGNDVGDGDGGPNLLMNTPVIGSAVSGTQGTVLTGQIDTANPTTAQIEFFSNPAPAPGEVVEAATFIGVGIPASDGTFAVAIPIDTAGLAITATATDAAGNTSEISEPVLSTPSPWVNLGFGLAGTNGTPSLAGGGTLAPNTQVGFVLSGALAGAPGVWILGASALNAPFFGGTLVPTPELAFGFTTDAAGEATLVGTWPAGIPSGVTIFVQAWILDPGGVQGFAASNAIRAITP